MTDDRMADGVCQDPLGALIGDHPRADDRAEAFRRILATEGYGHYFPALVERMHGREALHGPPYAYKHLREFVRDLERHGAVRTERIGPQKRPPDRPQVVYPTEEAVAFAATDAGQSVLEPASKQSPSAEGVESSAGSASSSEAVANGEGRLKRREALNDARVWGLLLRDCAAKRLGHERGPDDVKTNMKYNTVGRALASRDRVLDGFAEAASAGVSRGAVITATTGEG